MNTTPMKKAPASLPVCFNSNLSPMPKHPDTVQHDHAWLMIDEFEPLMPSKDRRASLLGNDGFSKWQSKQDRNRERRLSRLSMGTHALPTASFQPLSRRVTNAKKEEVLCHLTTKVLALVLRAEFLESSFLQNVTCTVSREWKDLSYDAACWMTSDCKTHEVLSNWKALGEAFPWGTYLADGGFKKVYQAYFAPEDRMEAVSVMEIASMMERGTDDIVRAEVYISLLLSNLSTVCPNFLRIYQSFLFAYEPPQGSSWSNKATMVNPIEIGKHSKKKGIYQYIRMDLCDGGDVEEFLKREKSIPVQDAVLPYLFQMAFAMYVAREKHTLRHFDLKLLNFFMKRMEKGKRKKKRCKILNYSFGEHRFVIKMPSKYSLWVKMGDYGTASTDAETMNSPITLDQVHPMVLF